MTPIFCRLARTALGWSVKDLAKASNLGTATLHRFEQGKDSRASTRKLLKHTFEAQGIIFLEDDVEGKPGIRFQP